MRTRIVRRIGLVLALMVLLGIVLACAPIPAVPPAPLPAQTTQFALETPAGAKVVKAFSKMDAACLGKTEWTIEVTPDTWLDVGSGWFAKDGPTAQDNWKHLSHVITLDGKEIKDLEKYFHGPKPLKLDCPDSPISAEMVGLEIFVPPLPLGDHKVTWRTAIESDLNDGYDDYPKGTVYEFTGTIRVSTEAAQAEGVSFPIGAFVTRDEFGRDRDIEFKADGSYSTILRDLPVTGSYSVNGDQIAFKDGFCRDRQGTYSWKHDSAGLTFQALEDRCMDRRRLLDNSAWAKKQTQ